MDFVCATEQNPPKEVSASIETYFSVWDSMFLDNIGIPLVISSIGRHMFDIKADFTGSICKRDNRTENNRIYPPTFVIMDAGRYTGFSRCFGWQIFFINVSKNKTAQYR